MFLFYVHVSTSDPTCRFQKSHDTRFFKKGHGIHLKGYDMHSTFVPYEYAYAYNMHTYYIHTYIQLS